LAVIASELEMYWVANHAMRKTTCQR